MVIRSILSDKIHKNANKYIPSVLRKIIEYNKHL